MRLEEYILEEELSERQFASLVDVSHAHINNIIRGRRTPSIYLIKKIEELTQGKVSLNDLLHPNAPSRLKSRKKKISGNLKE